MASASEEVALHCLIIGAILRKKKIQKKSQREWSKQWLLERDKLKYSSSSTDVANELRLYPANFHNYLRLDEETYLHLLNIVSPLIERENTVMRAALTPHERLTATLMYLASGCTYEDLKFSTCISAPALSKLIPETCEAIYQTLAKDYLKCPTTETEWMAIAQQFEARCRFPNCLGVVGGKHIAFAIPRDSASSYLNYLHFHSMVLMVIVNANYEFTYIHFGTKGQVPDGRVIEFTDFHDKLIHKELNIPPPSANGLPFVFIANDSFALRPEILKPYSARDLNDRRERFNERLFPAHKLIENVFNKLLSRFGVLNSRINLKLENVPHVVKACCALHNFLRKNTSDKATSPDPMDWDKPEMEMPGSGRVRQGPRLSLKNVAPLKKMENHGTLDCEEGQRSRDMFIDYFSNEGDVS